VSFHSIDLDAILIPFVVIVLPLWLWLHYGAKWRQAKVLTSDNERNLGELSELASRLQSRIDNLERLLDAAVPDWRKKS
jgi:phage shock protein B